MGTRIIAEIGSCWNGKIEYGKEAIERIAEAGAQAIKFQLFPNRLPYVKENVYLPHDTYLEFLEYANTCGLDCMASVFDEESFEFLMKTNPVAVKFAYSKKDELGLIHETLAEGIEAIVSCDVMTEHAVPDICTKLYCIPEYPVRYRISFEGLFPRFDGFSDHSLGIDQTLEAIAAGAEVIEKHVTLNHSDIKVPDSRFAITMAELTNLVRDARMIA